MARRAVGRVQPIYSRSGGSASARLSTSSQEPVLRRSSRLRQVADAPCLLRRSSRFGCEGWKLWRRSGYGGQAGQVVGSQEPGARCRNTCAVLTTRGDPPGTSLTIARQTNNPPFDRFDPSTTSGTTSSSRSATGQVVWLGPATAVAGLWGARRSNPASGRAFAETSDRPPNKQSALRPFRPFDNLRDYVKLKVCDRTGSLARPGHRSPSTELRTGGRALGRGAKKKR